MLDVYPLCFYTHFLRFTYTHKTHTFHHHLGPRAECELVRNSRCGGFTIDRLEDGTPNPWEPTKTLGGINDCKKRCSESRLCKAFEWDSRVCVWKRGA